MEPAVMNLGLCAERTALFSALAQGEKNLKLSRFMLELSSLVILWRLSTGVFRFGAECFVALSWG